MARRILLCLLLLAVRAPAQAEGPRLCGTAGALSGPARTAGETGGRYLTARGTLRVLMVFASFPDDERSHPWWPAHQAPLRMREFLDPDTSTHSPSPFKLTGYFSQMSLGQFHLVGDVLWVEAAHAESAYANGSWARANIGCLTVARPVSGDAGCNDATLIPTAIGFDLSGLGVTTPLRARVFIFNGPAAYERRRGDVDTCTAAWTSDPASVEFVDASPLVLVVQGPVPAAFKAALVRAVTTASGSGG